MLTNNKNGTWRFVHNIDKKTLPYFSRNPERAKFTNGFKPIVGALVRRSMGYDVSDSYTGTIIDVEKLLSEVDVDVSAKDNFISIFTAKAISDAKLPALLAYLPLSDGKESTGEIRIAEFIDQLFKLSDNTQWKEFLRSNKSGNLYEQLVVSNLKPLNSASESKDVFAYYRSEDLVEKFNHDLVNLTNSRNFFDSHYELFFAFYYFTYSIMLISSIEQFGVDSKSFKPFYALENEHISQSRWAAGRQSYKNLRTSAKNLLADSDVLVYLNYLLDSEDFLFLPQIMQLDGSKRDDLISGLRMTLNGIEKMENVINEHQVELADADLPELISHLRGLIVENHEDPAPISRYVKSLDEIANFEFTKSRGRLGKVFNLSEELEIMLVGVIVGRENMLLATFFDELEKRGIFLDRSSRDALTEDLDSRNLLEKMSDSGDAQYVKSLL